MFIPHVFVPLSKYLAYSSHAPPDSSSYRCLYGFRASVSSGDSTNPVCTKIFQRRVKDKDRQWSYPLSQWCEQRQQCKFLLDLVSETLVLHCLYRQSWSRLDCTFFAVWFESKVSKNLLKRSLKSAWSVSLVVSENVLSIYLAPYEHQLTKPLLKMIDWLYSI